MRGLERRIMKKKTSTVKEILQKAIEPLGSTLYVYGGCWNKEDTGTGPDALKLGLSPEWKEFYDANDGTYDFDKHRYEIHNGIDCTGLIGYACFQVFEDEYSDKGYVIQSGKMGDKYVEIFGGENVLNTEIKNYRPGDVMNKAGHVYFSIGKCEDGSLLLLHASPPALSFCGTVTPDGNEDSDAVRLAKKYMTKYYPETMERYPNMCMRKVEYLNEYNQYRWDRKIMQDPDGLDSKTPEEILQILFNER